MTKRILALTGLLTALMLPACKAADKSQTKINVEPVNVLSVPHAMLPDNVSPTAYRIDMIMDPDADGFSGTVDIDIDIAEPTSLIWIHGKEMLVEGGEIRLADGTTQAVSFAELPASEAPSGIAKITSDKVIPAGKATLHLPYKTPYNLNLNSAYKVVRGDDAYIVTQFEPLGAREAFPSFDEPRFKVPFTLSITSPADDFVFSNTPETKTTTLDNGWIKHDFAKTLPLPTYLIAFGAGPYEVVEFADLPNFAVSPRAARAESLIMRLRTQPGLWRRLKTISVFRTRMKNSI